VNGTSGRGPGCASQRRPVLPLGAPQPELLVAGRGGLDEPGSLGRVRANLRRQNGLHEELCNSEVLSPAWVAALVALAQAVRRHSHLDARLRAAALGGLVALSLEAEEQGLFDLPEVRLHLEHLTAAQCLLYPDVDWSRVSLDGIRLMAVTAQVLLRYADGGSPAEVQDFARRCPGAIPQPALVAPVDREDDLLSDRRVTLTSSLMCSNGEGR
jgi:hypothetical protein